MMIMTMTTTTTTTTKMIQSGSSKHDDVSSTSHSFASLPIEDCVYRGEGNANIVISLPHEQRVIRFRKLLPGEASPDDDDSYDEENDDKIRIKREVEFVRLVVFGYLGSYVQIPEIVRYDAKSVAELLEIIRPFRPEERRQKKYVKNYATKMQDYTFLPLNFANLDPDPFQSKSTFAIEIKPKQGYQRDEEQLLQKCPYCLTQYYKLRKKVIAARSSYCPFDLFSGDKARMKRAIEGLLKSPQNNLKIFKDGSIVYTEGFNASDFESVLADWRQSIAALTNETNVNLFCNLTCTALLHSFPDSKCIKVTGATSESDRVHRRRTFDVRDSKDSDYVNADIIAKARKVLSCVQEECKRNGKNLPKDCVLERILSMQRLPYRGTRHVYDIYEKYATSIDDEFVYNRLIKCSRVCTEERMQRTRVGAYIERHFSKYTEKEPVDRNGNRCTNFDWSVTEIAGNKRGLMNNSNECKINSSCDNEYWIDKSNNESVKYDSDKTHNDIINNEDLLALQNYLLFCTARDCSILITFRQLNPKAMSNVPRESVIKISEDLCFLTSIRVSDLDPKSIHSIAKHRRRDSDVLNSVIFLLEKEKESALDS